MTEKLVIGFRWFGFVLLPFLAGGLVGFINLYLALVSGANVGNSLLFPAFDGGLQGFVFSYCAYKIAPRSKMRATRIFIMVVSALAIFAGALSASYTNGLAQVIKMGTFIVGMVLGLYFVPKNENNEQEQSIKPFEPLEPPKRVKVRSPKRFKVRSLRVSDGDTTTTLDESEGG